ncbi:PTS sugar transporter subunit IIA [Thermoflavimicrobium dichotomicum]|uniref:Ascorbate-specific PTS system EIIA component n=1 Tax=Thermoflavimicrobium dichotomicum TaxID=46223 RepID=A0A1I3TM90_9BACL|nr:PTS sugar transporter subunit IIA [Thermoflavimicrobium dichotomicum]SFJ71662.1 PTS system, mannitol-specific IIA component/PTS system, ascorbate-specific IIA component [Thermoflavimicrobium dichotomicum]
MLSEYLKDNINFLDEVSSWEESIKEAADPLLKKGFITAKYIQDMIENVNINGPYIVIAPGIAMPHAKNEGGVIKTSISFLKLKNSVFYPEEKEVSIVFVLAAVDSSEHLELISDLASLLIDEDIMTKFKNSNSEEEIINLIKMVE